MAVRYVVVPSARGTGESARAAREFAAPPSLTRALASQLDLRLLASDPATVIYENASWGPGRALLPSPAAGAPVAAGPGGGLPDKLGSGADLSGAKAVLPGKGPIHYKGRLDAIGEVLVSEAPSSNWRLSAGGHDVPRQSAFGVANAYAVSQPGSAVLSFRTPLVRYGALLVEVALWVIAIRMVRRLRRRHSPPPPEYLPGPQLPPEPVTVDATT